MHLGFERVGIFGRGEAGRVVHVGGFSIYHDGDLGKSAQDVQVASGQTSSRAQDKTRLGRQAGRLTSSSSQV